MCLGRAICSVVSDYKACIGQQWQIRLDLQWPWVLPWCFLVCHLFCLTTGVGNPVLPVPQVLGIGMSLGAKQH